MPNGVKWVATLLAIPLSSFMILLGIVDLGFDVRSLVKGRLKNKGLIVMGTFRKRPIRYPLLFFPYLEL